GHDLAAARALAVADLAVAGRRRGDASAQLGLVARALAGGRVEAARQLLELPRVEPQPAARVARVDLDPAAGDHRAERLAAARAAPAASARRRRAAVPGLRDLRLVGQQIGEGL